MTFSGLSPFELSCVLCSLAGFLSQLLCRMTEGPREEETEQRLKRSQEEDEEDQGVKRRKAEGERRDNDRKYPKKKVVLLMAYSGKGYYGMQVLQGMFLVHAALRFLRLID